MKSSSLPARSLKTWCFCVVLAALTAAGATGAEFTYQYFRFNPVKLRTNTGNAIQIAEFKLRRGTVDVTSGATVTAPNGTSPAGETPAFIKDGSLLTKWYSSTRSAVVFAFSAPVTVDNYSFATANDFEGRDPVSWTLEGSETGPTGPWSRLDDIADFATTTVRRTWLPDFTLPVELPPEINSFTVSRSVVRIGQTVDFQWSTLNDTTLTLTPQPGDLAGVFPATVTPPANKDTVYTLTAANSVASRTSRKTIRAVAGGPSTWRYVRFTPLALRDPAGTNIQMADFLFQANTTDDDEANDEEILPIAARIQTGLYTETAAEGPNKLIDGNSSTKWYSATAVPLIFDLGFEKTFDAYRITSGNDFPSRDPFRWLLEGSNSDSGPWTRIDDLSTFDYDFPLNRFTSFLVPLPGGSLPPLATLGANGVLVPAGDPVTFNWTTSDAATVTLTPLPGAVDLSGTAEVVPTASGLFTLTATSPAGFETVRTFPMQVAAVPTTVNYPDFGQVNGALSLLGNAEIVNDFAVIPQPGNVQRLRLTPDNTTRSGTAWFGRKLSVGDGFDTTFGFQLTKAVVDRGADGLAFIIQNSPLGNGAVAQGENGLPTNAVTVKFDSFLNSPEPSNAFVEVRSGTTILSTFNLVGVPGITINTASNPVGLTSPAATAIPHVVRIKYEANTLAIWFDGVPIISGLALDLFSAGAVDAQGKAYVGFAARTGGFAHASDVTSWILITPTPAGPDLAILDYQLNTTTGTGSLTWASTPGRSYRITASSTAATFPQVLRANIPASLSSTTTATFSFTASGRLFLRVEQE